MMINSEYYSTITFLDKQKFAALEKNPTTKTTITMGNEVGIGVKEVHEESVLNCLQLSQQVHKLSVTKTPNSNLSSDTRRNLDSETSNKKLMKPIESNQHVPSKAQPGIRNIAKMKLPIYSGNPEEWHYFRASYETSTATCEFSDSENLVRLLDSLRGPALECVRGLLIIPKLVPKAINTLDRLYGNPETLLEWHLEKVRKLEKPNPDRLNTCVAFSNALEQLCDLMEAAELEHRMTDSALVEEFVLKLPNIQILGWKEHAKVEPSVTLRTLSDFASMKVANMREADPIGYRAILKTALPPIQGPKTDQANPVKTGALKREKSTLVLKREKSTLATTDAAGDKIKKEDNNNKRCRWCKRTTHFLWHCREFAAMHVEARTVLVESWKICKSCLNDHLVEGKSKCPTRIRCNVGKCHKSHNSLLHPGESD